MLQAQLSGHKLKVSGTAAVDTSYVALSISPVSLRDNDASGTQVTVSGTATGPISHVDLRGITNTGVSFYDFSADSGRLTVIGTSHDDTLTSFFDTPVRDFFRGRGGDDRIDTGFGNDRLEGGAGNDVINGGAGDDVAYYSGDRSDYRIEVINGDYQITDLRRGSRDGHDIVGNIETLHFADKEISLASPSKLVVVANGHGLTVSGHAATEGFYVTIDLDAQIVQDNNITSTYVDIQGRHSQLYRLDLSDLRDSGGVVNAGTFDSESISRHVIGSAQRDYITFGFGDDLTQAGGGDDFISGFSGNDRLYGQAGNDLISGGGGNDQLFGGGGNDTALYSGNAADYLVEFVAGGYRVTDNTPGGGFDGVDTLAGIEHLQFSDQTVDLAAMALQSHASQTPVDTGAMMVF